MPEGSDVAVETNRLKKTILGWKFKNLKHFEKGKKPDENQYSRFLDFISSGNQKITEIECHGKKTWLQIGGVWNILFSYAMSGTFVLDHEVGDGPPNHDPKNFTMEITLQSDSGVEKSVYFSDIIAYGNISFMDDTALKNAISKLGPDPLKGNIPDGYLASLKEKKSSKEISWLLCNQSILSGIGNVTASEILYKASIHPTELLGNIPDAKLNEIQKIASEEMNRIYVDLWNERTPKYSVYEMKVDPKRREVTKFKSPDGTMRYCCEEVQKLLRK